MTVWGLTRVAFGCARLEDIQPRVDACACGAGTNRHSRISSRRVPRRSLAGGAIFWIIRHTLVARQPILGVDETADDHGPLAIIRLGLTVVPVRPRACRAHQGWRYIAQADWPAELADDDTQAGGLPPALEHELAALGLA